jgi:hypothetical protein
MGFSQEIDQPGKSLGANQSITQDQNWVDLPIEKRGLLPYPE